MTETTKPGLFTLDMLKGHQVYKNKAGEKVPGVTTVLGLLAKPALIRWANKMGLQGIDTTKYVQKAADIGTVAHARIEAYLRGMELDETGLSPEMIDKSSNSFIRFDDWWKSQAFSGTDCERQLVSEPWQVGGTLDILTHRPNLDLVLVDIKTSSGIYPEMKIQACAYAQMYFHVTGTPIEEVWIVRVGKEENDDLQAVQIGSNERWACVQAFEHLADLYPLLKSIK